MSDECKTSVGIGSFIAVSARYLGVSSQQPDTGYYFGRASRSQGVTRAKPIAPQPDTSSQLHA
jgi:hypothetical protein